MKRCPMCAEQCQTEALICPHCRHAFTAQETDTARRNTIGHRWFTISIVAFVILVTISSLGGPEGLGKWLKGIEDRAATEAERQRQ